MASPGFTAEELTTVIIESFVDQTARLLLAGAGWHAPITDTRRLAARAARAATRALSAPAGEFRVDPELGETLDDLATIFDQAIRRAEGEPVVQARLRLALPDDPQGDWPLSLELVDPDDRSRWCSAADVAGGLPAALRLAGDQRFLPMLADCIATARVDIEMLAPWLTSWLASQLSSQLADSPPGVDLDTAAFTLEAVDALAAVDIEVLTPERLTRRAATTRGVAQPKGAAGTGRFNAAAIIDWTVVVDDTPIDEAVLQRAAASGAGLINVNGRWVRLDRTEARRALANLAEHRRDHAELSALEAVAAGRRVGRCRGSTDDRGPTRRPSPPPAGSATSCRAFPTRRWPKGPSLRGSWPRCAPISGAVSAGCSSFTRSDSAAAWPTTWVWARHPPRSLTSPRSRARTW